MRTPILFSTILVSFALAACGGSNEPAASPEAEHSADKAEEAADKAEVKADKAENKADEAASDAKKAEEAK